MDLRLDIKPLSARLTNLKGTIPKARTRHDLIKEVLIGDTHLLETQDPMLGPAWATKNLSRPNPAGPKVPRQVGLQQCNISYAPSCEVIIYELQVNSYHHRIKLKRNTNKQKLSFINIRSVTKYIYISYKI